MSAAETLIAELVTAVASKDVTAITMTAVALGRLLERLEPSFLTAGEVTPTAEIDSPPDGQRRPQRVDGPPRASNRTGRTEPGPNDNGRSVAELQDEIRDGTRRPRVIDGAA